MGVAVSTRTYRLPAERAQARGQERCLVVPAAPQLELTDLGLAWGSLRRSYYFTQISSPALSALAPGVFVIRAAVLGLAL